MRPIAGVRWGPRLALIGLLALAPTALTAGQTPEQEPTADAPCDAWLALPEAPDGYSGHPWIWAACQHERLAESLRERPQILAGFLGLERDLVEMCRAMVALAGYRNNGGNWSLHEQPRTVGEISRELCRLAALYRDGRASESSDSIRAELQRLRSRVRERIERPTREQMVPFDSLSPQDSAQVESNWRILAWPYIESARAVTSESGFLAGHDRVALEVMRLVDRMLRLYVDQDWRANPMERTGRRIR